MVEIGSVKNMSKQLSGERKVGKKNVTCVLLKGTERINVEITVLSTKRVAESEILGLREC
jgi:hypothetical protein